MKGYPKHTKTITVWWLDSASPGTGSWLTLDNYDVSPTCIVSRGFLIKETKTFVVVASSVSTSGQVLGLITVPKVAITKRKDG